MCDCIYNDQWERIVTFMACLDSRGIFL